MLKALKRELIEIADPDKAHVLSSFLFSLGFTVPQQRRIAENYQGLSGSDIKKLLYRTIH